ncbi:MAG: potassium-transporting ATPase subunit B, partial [Erysipelotrichia bacterium]|nr:potassium-transporting ATPase subunit B [Erysipelotrichia bacterium]
MKKENTSIFKDKKIMLRAIKDSFLKMDPRLQIKNPVMFIVYVASILSTILLICAVCGIHDNDTLFILYITLLLYFTVLFANFAEAIAEGRGKAQADALRASRKDVLAKKIVSIAKKDEMEEVDALSLRKGDLIYVEVGDQIAADGDVIEGAASVDESAITGESAPVIRESGGDRSAVTGGTTILSDYLIIQVSNDPGKSFMDKMIAMVEGASRKKTPNEVALQILLVALTIIFLVVCVSLYCFADFAYVQIGTKNATSITSLLALLVCLA